MTDLEQKMELFRLATTPEALAKQLEEGSKNYQLVLADRARSCLSVWYPLVENLVPTPKTEIVRTDIQMSDLWDHKKPEGFDHFLNQVKGAISRIGSTPVFLRTGCASGKHSWKNTCYLDDVSKLTQHIGEIAEFSGMADLPIDVWVVREMLPVDAPFTAFYGEMPITKERRYFVKDGKVICHHPYWPKEAFVGNELSARNWRGLLKSLNTETAQERHFLTTLTQRVGQAVQGFWSVDWLWTKNGWYLTDMGVGEQSYHWPGCKEAV